MPYHETDEACDCWHCRSERCSDCRRSLADGEGWDGRCGNCADRREEAEQYLADAAASDTHSSDVDPGGEPWES